MATGSKRRGMIRGIAWLCVGLMLVGAAYEATFAQRPPIKKRPPPPIYRGEHLRFKPPFSLRVAEATDDVRAGDAGHLLLFDRTGSTTGRGGGEEISRLPDRFDRWSDLAYIQLITDQRTAKPGDSVIAQWVGRYEGKLYHLSPLAKEPVQVETGQPELVRRVEGTGNLFVVSPAAGPGAVGEEFRLHSTLALPGREPIHGSVSVKVGAAE